MYKVFKNYNFNQDGVIMSINSWFSEAKLYRTIYATPRIL